MSGKTSSTDFTASPTDDIDAAISSSASQPTIQPQISAPNASKD